MKQEILRLKKEMGAVILAHNYQRPEIQDIADFLGDSLELAKISKDLKEKVIVFCGVRFMAESAKILSPGKKVFLPVLDAGCPLADTITPDELIKFKQENPGAWVVSYVNSSAEIKALSNACCTSGNAISVVKNIPAKKVIFVPDKHLGSWVQKNVSDKEIILWEGFCYVHELFKEKDVDEAKKRHRGAVIMVHPECREEVQEKADFIFSTAGMLKKAAELSRETFIVGTEEGLIYRLKKENPDKEFYSLGSARICMDMKKTTLQDLYNCLKLKQYEINLDSGIILKAKRALDEMVKWI